MLRPHLLGRVVKTFAFSGMLGLLTVSVHAQRGMSEEVPIVPNVTDPLEHKHKEPSEASLAANEPSSLLNEMYASPVSSACPVCTNQVRSPVACQNGHLFCASCMEQWLKVKQWCPTCRIPITPSSPCIPLRCSADANGAYSVQGNIGITDTNNACSAKLEY